MELDDQISETLRAVQAKKEGAVQGGDAMKEEMILETTPRISPGVVKEVKFKVSEAIANKLQEEGKYATWRSWLPEGFHSFKNEILWSRTQELRGATRAEQWRVRG